MTTTDPKFCKTIDELLSTTCKEVQATGKSLTDVYEKHIKQLHELSSLALQRLTQGRVLGSTYIIIGENRDPTTKKRVFHDAQQAIWEPNPIDETDADKLVELAVIHVYLHFYETSGKFAVDDIASNMEKFDPDGSGHAAILLIDLRHKTIDYSDPHGGKARWNKAVYPLLQEWLHDLFPGFDFLPPWQTCPNLGVQSILREGLCVLFSSLYAFLRLKCPDVSALELQTYITSLGHRRLRELTAGWFCTLLKQKQAN